MLAAFSTNAAGPNIGSNGGIKLATVATLAAIFNTFLKIFLNFFHLKERLFLDKNLLSLSEVVLSKSKPENSYPKISLIWFDFKVI